MTKKIISILLILTIIFSVVQTGMAASAKSTNSSDTNVLDILGVVSENVQEDYAVTRSEFLENVLKAFDIPILAADSEPIFTDMTKAHKYYASVVTAYERGIIRGYGGKFRPDDPITADEAMIMTVSALCESSLTYDMIRYISDRLKLFDGAAKGGTIVFSDMKRILYNALAADSFSYTFSEGNTGLAFDGEETFFEKIWGIKSLKGMVESADGISIYGKNVRSDMAVIGGKSFSARDFSVSEMLGTEAKVFYREIDETPYIVYAYPTKNNNCKKFTYHDFTEYAGGMLKFDRKTYKLTQKTTFIYNNRLLDGAEIQKTLETAQGEYFLIDNDDDSKYDVVIVRTPKVYVSAVADTEREIIVDNKFGELALGKYLNYAITDVRGKVLSTEDIKANSRLLVYDPGNFGYTIKIVVTEDVQEAEILGKRTDDTYRTVSAGENIEYCVSPYSKYTYDEFDKKSKYKLYFDTYGEIIDADILSRSDIEAIYLIKVRQSDDGRVTAKIMKSDGSFADAEFAEKVSLRGKDGTTKSIKTSEELFEKLLGGDEAVKRQLVFAEFDEDGKIKKLIQISDNEGDSYHLQKYEKNADGGGNAAPAESRRWVTQICSFSNQVQLKSSTKVFVAPYTTIESPDTSLMGVTSVASFSNDANYPMYNSTKQTGYNLVPVVVNPNELAADYMVIECPDGKTFGVEKRVAGVVVEAAEVWDDYESELVNRMTIMQQDGNKVEYNCEKAVANRVSVGDVVEIKYISGTVRDRELLVYYDASKNLINIVSSFDRYDSSNRPIDGDNLIGWRYYAETRLTKGKVLDIQGNYARLSTLQQKIDLEEIVDISAAKLLKINTSTGKYEVYDKGYLKKGDEFIGLLKHGKMMMFIFYEK